MTAAVVQPRRLTLASDEVADAGFLLALLVLAVFGFRTTYGGTAYLFVGFLGSVLGVGVSVAAIRLRQPVAAELAVGAVLIFLLGGAVAAPGTAVGGLLPTVATWTSIADVSIHGWKDLLTTAPPVGRSQHLLVLPYIIGLVCGVVGNSVARRAALPLAALLVPCGALALSILFGTEKPASLVLQGSLFTGVALAWLWIRNGRRRGVGAPMDRVPGTRRAAIGMIAVSSAVGLVVGPHLPLGATHRRVVLTRYVTPPFDQQALTSPLIGFRRYRPDSPNSLATTTLFTVSGLPEGTQMPIAVMDTYNGLAWGFGGGTSVDNASGTRDVFRRYGSSLPAAGGAPVQASVTVGALGGVWLPLTGLLHTIDFSGAGAAALDSAFRYDSFTSAGAEPDGLAAGERYHFVADVPASPSSRQLAAAGPGDETVTVSVPPDVAAIAAKWTTGIAGTWAKVAALAGDLKEQGKFGESLPLSPPGEDAGRLSAFIDPGPADGGQIVGDDEQYAATLALMINSVQVPARVVLGAVVGSADRSQEITGSDIHAWVQVDLAKYGWVTLPTDSFLPTAAPSNVIPKPHEVQRASVSIAPPALTLIAPPPENLNPPANTHASNKHQLPHQHHPKHAAAGNALAFVATGATYAGPPVGVLLALAGLLLGLKGLRRLRRRRAAPMLAIAGGWSEVLDLARDARLPISGGTRREQALRLSDAQLSRLASLADAHIWGPEKASREGADSFWIEVERSRAAIRARLGAWGRLKAALSPASLVGMRGAR